MQMWDWIYTLTKIVTPKLKEMACKECHGNGWCPLCGGHPSEHCICTQVLINPGIAGVFGVGPIKAIPGQCPYCRGSGYCK